MTDDRKQWQREFFAATVPEVAALTKLTNYETALIAARLWDALHEAVSRDDAEEEAGVYAEEEIRQRGIQGCEKWIESEKRRISGSIFIQDADGKRRRMKNQTVRGKRKRRDDGTVAYQQAMWVTFDYDEVVDFSQQLSSIAYGSAAKAEAFLRVRDAYSRHRQAVNAGEACRLARIDPNEIEITDADIRRMRGA